MPLLVSWVFSVHKGVKGHDPVLASNSFAAIPVAMVIGLRKGGHVIQAEPIRMSEH